MSRTHNLVRNAKWIYVSTFLDIVLGIISRTVFVQVMGVTYLGLNAFYASVIGILSVSELGIGTVLNTQLYKPLAGGDYEKIKSILTLYKKAYYLITCVIFVSGCAAVPLIRGMVKSTERLDHLEIFFLLYLANTAISYVVSYKFSLPNSEQKLYLQTNINSVFSILNIIASIIIISVWKNYLLYLVSQLSISIIKLIVSNSILNRRYPIFLDRQVRTLSKNERKELYKNIRAGSAYKLSEVLVYTSTNLIMTSKIGVDITGRFSNYSMFTTYIERFTKPLVDSTGPGIGEYINTHDTESKVNLLKTYHFIGFWIYGFSAIGLACLSTPLIHLWLGADKTVLQTAVLVYCFNFFCSGLSRPYQTIQSAHGIYYLDWYVGIIGAIVSITVSLFLVPWIGITGVFLGSTCAHLTIALWSPAITYKRFFVKSVANYYTYYFGYLIIGIITGVLCLILTNIVMKQVTIINYVIALLILCIIPNLLWFLLFYRTREFLYVKSMVASIIKTKKKHS